MAKPKIEYDFNKIEELASYGLTQEQIAHNIGIHPSTLSKHKGSNCQLSEAIKRGAAIGIKQIANALFQSAMNGNVTAQIFFLKNRAPAEWYDRKEQSTYGDIRIVIDEQDAALAGLTLDEIRERQ
jgi:DNA-binding CsgD family transcriptional regulator